MECRHLYRRSCLYQVHFDSRLGYDPLYFREISTVAGQIEPTAEVNESYLDAGEC